MVEYTFQRKKVLNTIFSPISEIRMLPARSLVLALWSQLSTDYKQILNNVTQSFGREAALSLR